MSSLRKGSALQRAGVSEGPLSPHPGVSHQVGVVETTLTGIEIYSEHGTIALIVSQELKRHVASYILEN